MNRFLLPLLWLTLSVPALCQDGGTPLLINAEARKTISLNGKWNIIIDRYENGYYDYRRKPISNGYNLNHKPENKQELVEYDFDKSPLMDVPGDWNTRMPELLYYEGTVWYKKSFSYHKPETGRTFLRFGAVNYQALVFVNGKLAGTHTGGFTPFNFDVSDLLTEGDNFIVVKVDNVRSREGVPTLKTDWWNYGGITRSVSLVETPEIFIQDYFIHLSKERTGEISGWIRLNGKGANREVKLEIPELKSSKIIRTGDDGTANFTLKASPVLWSPENPKLYDIILSSGEDRITDRIGFRTIEVKGSDILLNGKPVFLRGIAIHEEAPYRSGKAFSRDDDQTLLNWAKEMNCNFVRLAHYPHNEEMTRLADEMGIMVWSEIPVYWTIQWENVETYKNAENQLEEMIARDKNRASVIIWSMANETPVGTDRNAFLQGLIDRTRSLDNTRLITAALEKHYPDGNNLHPVVDDPIGASLDLLSFNEYIGWYDGLPEKCNRVTWTISYNKPVIISEFGGGALQGLHGAADERWTEEYQEDLYIQTIKMLEKLPNLQGTAPWILMDFRSPNRVLPGIQDGWNRKGVISDQGNRKKAFYIMQDWYKKKAAEQSTR
ncbi:MAG: glycoside hydrolase family 2 protein [Bacteroidota bacterium]